MSREGFSGGEQGDLDLAGLGRVEDSAHSFGLYGDSVGKMCKWAVDDRVAAFEAPAWAGVPPLFLDDDVICIAVVNKMDRHTNGQRAEMIILYNTPPGMPHGIECGPTLSKGLVGTFCRSSRVRMRVLLSLEGRIG